MMGAAVGCYVGHHQAHKAAKQQQGYQQQTTGSAPNK
jgi:hypothetical protein